MDNADNNSSAQSRLQRHVISGVINAYNSATGQHIGRLVNIHREGMMLMGEPALSAEALYQCELVLPEAVGGVERIHIGIDCLWIREAGGSAAYWSGCRIIDVSDEDLLTIDKLVEIWGD